MTRQNDAEEVGAAVRFLRAIPNWSQERLAAGSGVDQARISLYEKGKKVPSPRTRERLVRAVGAPGSFFEEVLPIVRRCRAAIAARTVSGTTLDAGGEISDVIRSISEAVHPPVAQAAADLVQAVRRSKTSIEEDRLAVDDLWESVKDCSLKELSVLIDRARDYQTPAFHERLRMESEKAVVEDPSRAVALAELTLKAGGRLATSSELREYENE